ncbi:MAG TPA: DUF3459 domain-containing protein, partial [Sphingomicrobium sp.]
QLGFSDSEPWLPVGESHADLAVDRQESRGPSLLHFTRDALKLRRDHLALRQGSMEIVQSDGDVLVFERAGDGERLRCTFNLSDRPASFRLAGKVVVSTGSLDGGELGPYSAVIEEIA